MSVRAIANLMLLVCAAVAGGCGAATPRAGQTGGEAPALIAGVNPSHGDMVSPVVRGGQDGLELVWFLARDDAAGAGTLDAAGPGGGAGGDGAVAAALAPFVHQKLPIDADTRSALERNGLRLVRVPLSDLGSLESGLTRVGPRNRDWLGWALEWREAFRGASIAEGSALMVNGARTKSWGGTLRVVARAWTAPAASGEGLRQALRIEMAVQLEEAGRAAGGSAFAAPDPVIDVRKEGRVIPGTAIDAEFEPGWAYVLTAERPGVSWGSRGAEESRGGKDDQGLRFAKPAEGDAAEGVALGPAAAPPPSVGEAMLTNAARLESGGPVKAVLIFIPRASSAAEASSR